MKKAVTIGILCSTLFMLSACSGSPVDNSKPTVVKPTESSSQTTKPTVDSSRGANTTVAKPTIDSSQGIKLTVEEGKKRYLEGCNPTDDPNFTLFCECTFGALTSKYGDDLAELDAAMANGQTASQTAEFKAIAETCRELFPAQ